MAGPRTLETIAYRIAGPIDALINLIINAVIPWIFLRSAASIPLVGLPSLYAFIGPMVFFATFFPALFGYRNGVKALSATSILPQWQTRAWQKAMSWAIVSSMLLGIVVYLINRAYPEMRVASLATILIDGLGSAVLAYITQVCGIFAARRDIQRLRS